MYTHGSPHLEGYRHSVSPVSHHHHQPHHMNERSVSPTRLHEATTAPYSTLGGVSAVPVASSSPILPASAGHWDRRGSQLSPPAHHRLSSPQGEQRSMVLAAVQQHWDDPGGLPNVVRDVQAALNIASVDDTIAVIESTLGKPLPLDLVAQCRQRISHEERRPPCVNGMMCPYVADRSHLDRYTHPCPKYFDTGLCPLMHNKTHGAYYSHEATDEGVYPDLNQVSPNTSPRQSVRGKSIEIGVPSPRSEFSYSPEEEYPSSGVYPPLENSYKYSQRMQPAEAWMSYFNLLRARDVNGVLAQHYTAMSNVQLTVRSEGLLTEFRGESGVRRYANWIINRLTNPSSMVIVSINSAEEGPVRVTWKSPTSGFKTVKEIIVFTATGQVEKQRITVDYERPDVGQVRRDKSMVDRPPPEPFSADVRLRGTPLTPANMPPQERQVHNSCNRVACPRATSPNSPRARRTAFHAYCKGSREFQSPTSTTKKRTRTPSRQTPTAKTPTPTPKQTARTARTTTPRKRLGYGSRARSESPEDQAATKIQASFRGRTARRQIQEKQEEEEAAKRIQASFRGKLVRKQLSEKREEDDAAKKIQANFRGRMVRRKMKEDQEEDTAATLIQANFRGRKARKELGTKTPSPSPPSRFSYTSPYKKTTKTTTTTTTTRSGKW